MSGNGSTPGTEPATGNDSAPGNGSTPGNEPTPGNGVRDVDQALRARERRLVLRRWLQPGIGIKRWVVVAFVGEMLVALAAAIMLRPLLAQRSDNGRVDILELLTLQFLPSELRAFVFFGVGASLFAYGAWRVVRAMVEPYRSRDESFAETLYQRRLRARGPRIVAIGGGTGLSVLLRGLKQVTSNITAVVTVADDGGSSGKLRTEMGLPPMGDIRMCIAALADAEPAMSSLLAYRFPAGNGHDPHFAGHAFGNLLIAALTDVSNGDFEEAVRESNRVLAVRGSVVPVAGRPITLHAELEDGTILEGESHIERAHGIKKIWITPDDVRPTAEALTAIAAADVVVIGPGSLYTSLLPPLLVPGMREALADARAARLFVCNVATQLGETEGYGVNAHLSALATHGLAGLIDAVVVNNNTHAHQLPNDPASPVSIDVEPRRSRPPLIVARDVVDDNNAHRHDSNKLTRTILELYDERTEMRREHALAN